MEKTNINYFCTSIKIREKIDSKREDIPEVVYEPVAVLTNKDIESDPNLRRHFNSKLKTERNDFPYQKLSKKMYVLLNEMYVLTDVDAKICSVGYKRDHPAFRLTSSGPTTIWSPEVILPQGGIITIAPAQIEGLVEALYGDVEGIYRHLEKAPAEQVIEYLALTDGSHDENFEAFFKANH